MTVNTVPATVIPMIAPSGKAASPDSASSPSSLAPPALQVKVLGAGHGPLGLEPLTAQEYAPQVARVQATCLVFPQDTPTVYPAGALKVWIHQSPEFAVSMDMKVQAATGGGVETKAVTITCLEEAPCHTP